ncbi:MAG: hypothetical protein J3K34DRAFT_445403, partial [Monoraphidium minutum]
MPCWTVQRSGRPSSGSPRCGPGLKAARAHPPQRRFGCWPTPARGGRASGSTRASGGPCARPCSLPRGSSACGVRQRAPPSTPRRSSLPLSRTLGGWYWQTGCWRRQPSRTWLGPTPAGSRASPPSPAPRPLKRSGVRAASSPTSGTPRQAPSRRWSSGSAPRTAGLMGWRSWRSWRSWRRRRWRRRRRQ